MYLLDTNHLTILQRGGNASIPLTARLKTVKPAEIATTVVSYHEQMQGWLAEANRLIQMKPEKQVEIYHQIERNYHFFQRIPMVSFDIAAAEEFQRLKKLHRKIGSMDLRIAAIAITQHAILLTQNVADFVNIQGLQIEDWSI
jgi:tRNA(fMet)-specific endonuclease VapC